MLFLIVSLLSLKWLQPIVHSIIFSKFFLCHCFPLHNLYSQCYTCSTIMYGLHNSYSLCYLCSIIMYGLHNLYSLCYPCSIIMYGLHNLYSLCYPCSTIMYGNKYYANLCTCTYAERIYVCHPLRKFL